MSWVNSVLRQFLSNGPTGCLTLSHDTFPSPSSPRPCATDDGREERRLVAVNLSFSFRCVNRWEVGISLAFIRKKTNQADASNSCTPGSTTIHFPTLSPDTSGIQEPVIPGEPLIKG